MHHPACAHGSQKDDQVTLAVRLRA
jgi:hypothetical protein